MKLAHEPNLTMHPAFGNTEAEAQVGGHCQCRQGRAGRSGVRNGGQQEGTPLSLTSEVISVGDIESQGRAGQCL